MKRALTIAGSDSGGGAGIQADLKTFAALGVYGMSVLTSITAQNTVGVQGIYDLPPEFVGLQIDSVLTDIGADAVKTGMLSNTKIIAVVAEKLRRYQVENLVIDPVMIAKSGDPLLREEAHVTLVHDLFPLAKVVTPNLHEARVLSRLPISNLEEMKEAAKAIHRLGPQNVVVKGGHLERESVDLLYDGHHFLELPGPRLETKNDHGTGCTFASAIAAGLAKGQDVPTAVKAAKEYITQALQGAIDWHLGEGHGPVHHFFAYGNIGLLTPSPIWATISLLEATKVTDLQKIAQAALEALEAKNAAREKVLPLSRELVRHSANTIRAVHRGELAEAKKMLAEGRRLAQELKDSLTEHPDLYHSGYTQDALKEFAEANITYALIAGEELPSPKELGVEYPAYLKGLGEAAGEMRRHILDLIRHGETERGEEILGSMEDIYGVLVTIDYPEAITHGLRRITDMVRGVLERTRGDLTLAIRQTELEKALKEFEERNLG